MALGSNWVQSNVLRKVADEKYRDILKISVAIEGSRCQGWMVKDAEMTRGAQTRELDRGVEGLLEG